VGLRRYEEMLPAIEAREADLLDLDDAELMELAEQAEDPEEICALGREAARRALGERAYDVQLLGVLAMLSGTSARWPPVRARPWPRPSPRTGTCGSATARST
jgi:preprotein translocase subunit SecA